jgi:hypothetical protein
MHLTQALSTESMYPSSLTPEEVSQLRQLQAEVLANSRQKAIETHAAVVARIGTPAERNMDATASARLLEAVVRATELESNLFGTKQPTRIVEESLRSSSPRLMAGLRWSSIVISSSRGGRHRMALGNRLARGNRRIQA